MTDIVSSPVSTLLHNRNIPFEQIVIPLSPDKKPIRALEEILGGLVICPVRWCAASCSAPI